MCYNQTRRICLLAVGLWVAVLATFAQDVKWTRRFYFELDKYDIRYDLRNNRVMMDSTVIMLKSLLQDPTVTNVRLDIISSSSLEASEAYNVRLTQRRNGAFLSELRHYVDIPFEVLVVHDNVFDWDQLYDLTAVSTCPGRQQALNVIRTVPAGVDHKQTDNRRKLRLMELEGGETYKYMKDFLFPDMRNTSVTITATRPAGTRAGRSVNTEPTPNKAPEKVIAEPPTTDNDTKDRRRHVFGVKTNMLYDLAMTPNIGVEFYLGKHITLNANWAYAWWNKDPNSFYWRAYGGDVEARYYFRNPSDRNDRLDHAFTGHHIGLYGLMCTYDYEFGENGQQAPKWSYGGGIDYGYSIAITRHLNLDFTLGLGCLYGKYYTYDPSTIKNDEYYWTATKHRKYWGPTKAEVSLVWVLGR